LRYGEQTESHVMKIISVNIGKAEKKSWAKSGSTGIYKRPVGAAIQIGKLGLERDAICDLKHHGGYDQAVYLYGQPDYDYWSKEIGRELEPGTFGENLTVESLESGKICVGDRFVNGSLVMEVTSPRIPCNTFAQRMNDKTFPKRFLAANRPGIYCRVLSEGKVQAGDALEYMPFEGVKVLAIEMNLTWNNPNVDEETKKRFLATPIHWKSRALWG
jgi:MOSC domain-containing protein YiiM